MRNVYLILLVLPLGVFAQKNKNVKPELKIYVDFDYSQLMVDEETEMDFLKREQEKKNGKKDGKGDKFVERWEENKRDFWAPSAVDGIIAKLGSYKSTFITEDKGNADYVVDVKIQYVEWAWKFIHIDTATLFSYPLRLEVVIHNKTEQLIDTTLKVIRPQYSGVYGMAGGVAVGNEVIFIDCYYIAGKKIGRILKKLITGKKDEDDEKD